ncbi:MAG: TatD family hydrolase [Bacteroidota bacterium]
MIDTHTHIYGKRFDADRQTMMQRAFDKGIRKFYLPGIDSEVIDRMLEMEHLYPDNCFAMMGLHPCSVNEKYKKELAIVEDWLAVRKFPAIGEIGLDFYWDKTYTSEQFEAFHFQIDLALKYQLPIVIHTRDAMPETIAVVKQYAGKNLRGIFHCFSGTFEQAMEIIEAGFYLGIGGVVTYKNGGLAEVVERIPLEHLVLETDAPYLTPVPFRGKRNESSYLIYIAEKLADIYKLPLSDIVNTTSLNAEHIFAY